MSLESYASKTPAEVKLQNEGKVTNLEVELKKLQESIDQLVSLSK
jgi:hypothetical protein